MSYSTDSSRIYNLSIANEIHNYFDRSDTQGMIEIKIFTFVEHNNLNVNNDG